MTFYQKELNRIKKVIFKNQAQVNMVIAVKNFIDRNYDNNLNLNLLSKTQFISKYHLIRLFKRYYGITPKQYWIDKRIEKSKEYLINGMTVTETCYAVGFTSLGSFGVLFKTKIGKSPAQFQKEQLSSSN